jgi:hypothetical protein
MMTKLKKWAKRFLLGVALLSVLLVWFLRGDGIDRAEWCGEHVKTVQGGACPNFCVNGSDLS